TLPSTSSRSLSATATSPVGEGAVASGAPAAFTGAAVAGVALGAAASCFSGLGAACGSGLACGAAACEVDLAALGAAGVDWVATPTPLTPISLAVRGGGIVVSGMGIAASIC